MEIEGEAVQEGLGGQRGGGGADAAFDGRPLPGQQVQEDQAQADREQDQGGDFPLVQPREGQGWMERVEQVEAELNVPQLEGLGGQRGGGGADAAFDGRPLPGQQVQEDQAQADREQDQGGDFPLVQPREGQGWMERVQGWMERVEQVDVEPYVPPMPMAMEVMEQLVEPYVPQMVTRPFP